MFILKTLICAEIILKVSEAVYLLLCIFHHAMRSDVFLLIKS